MGTVGEGRGQEGRGGEGRGGKGKEEEKRGRQEKGPVRLWEIPGSAPGRSGSQDFPTIVARWYTNTKILRKVRGKQE